MEDETKKQKAKAANQAWRKKPRKFAPKSRLGCKTCKMRRVKCDLAQPVCLKCHSTGRACDGYGETPLAYRVNHESSYSHNASFNGVEGCGSSHLCTTITPYQHKHRQPDYRGLTSQNLRPFTVLPVTEPAQTEAMRFFEYISIKHLSEYHPSESWRRNLMLFSQTVPSVRHAATALALIHRNYLDRHSGGEVHQPRPLNDCLQDKAPLLYYNRAIHLLLNQEGGDGAETTAITLLVCYLFTCFDHLAGNYVQAIKHLRGGVQLSRNTSTIEHAKSSGFCTLISQVTRQIRRLDMQAVTFLVDWTPADLKETLASQLPPSDSAFQSLDQAAEQLQLLIARVMGMHYAGQKKCPMGKMPSSPLASVDAVRGQLEAWSGLLERMLRQGSPSETGFEAYRLISLLRLQHTVAWILLRGCGPGCEMDYDDFLPQFKLCVALADNVAAAHERYAGSLSPTFTPEVGMVPVLYIVGSKCRHPIVRREVLRILRRQPMREAVWDSIIAAKVIERIIDIEEGGVEEGETVQSMDQVVLSQRIESFAWVQSSTIVNITYTFCERVEIHTEALLL